MAVPQFTADRSKSRTAGLALVLVAACYAAPLLAAAPNAILCDETGEATLDFPFIELITKSVDHDISMTTLDEIAAAAEKKDMSPARLFAPRAEAAIRNAFSDEEKAATQDHVSGFTRTNAFTPIANADRKIDSDNGDNAQRSKSSELTTRLPGVSDVELARFKKQMYRRDI